jgi:thiamine biosynthesis lipoprotein
MGERPRGNRRTTMAMDTFVTIEISGHAGDAEADAAIERAFGWFRDVEACCSRFNPGSELAALTHRVGEDVPVSTMLFEALQFALALAHETGGAFDPTVGRRMQALGFNREYRTGALVETPATADEATSYRDVHVDPSRRIVKLDRPVVLDLGAVAKGLAIDLAARELAPFQHYAIDAGGDLYLAGRNPAGEPWTVGIRDPRVEGRLVDVVDICDRAVCTSGDYERRQPDSHRHHIVDPRTDMVSDVAVSVTVIGSPAMLADGLATAAFVLGPQKGLGLLERHGVRGLIISPALERYETKGGLA